MKLKKVNCSLGAPMGRQESVSGDKTIPFVFALQRMYLDAGGYDNGGAYWGFPNDLYHATTAGPYESNLERQEMFVRAKDRDEAKNKVRKMFPRARFYR